MAGYERQSTATIQPGQSVAAGPVNAEFNQLESAFNDSTGHAHDGTAGNGPKINLTTSVTGVLPGDNGGGSKNNFSATVAPTVDDDSGDGYSIGSRWVDTVAEKIYICLDATVGAASWGELVSSVSGVVTVPTLTATTLNGGTLGSNLDANSTYTITNLPLPTNGGDVASKTYADSLSFSSALPGVNATTEGQVITNDGSISFWAGLSPKVASSNTDLLAGNFYRVTATGITLTLPASPTAGDEIGIIDGEVFDDGLITIARNGNTIMGLAEDMIVATKGIRFRIWFNGSDWRLF